MKKTVLSVLLGMGLGVIMALVLLYMMAMGDFMISDVLFIPCLLAGCALPLCMEFLRRKETFRVKTIEVAMIVTSWAISLLYGFYVNHASSLALSYSNIFMRVLSASSLLHGISLIICLGNDLLRKRK